MSGSRQTYHNIGGDLLISAGMEASETKTDLLKELLLLDDRFNDYLDVNLD